MCLLINHPANTNFTDEFLLDVYDGNSDGFGAVYAENGELGIIKTLGTPDQIKKIYLEELAHRDCIIHYRMKTHGTIDLDNCHPYKVTDNVWMAHNGILSFGNPIDPKRSDTWHFIEFVLRPALLGQPELLFEMDFQDYISDMIGASNKFAFMHSDGRTVVINESSGVQFQGAWLSNTYAWSAHKFGVGIAKTFTPSKYYSGWENTYDRAAHKAQGGEVVAFPTKHSSKELYGWDRVDTYGEAFGDYEVTTKKLSYKKVIRAAYNSWTRGGNRLHDWVLDAPHKAAYLLVEWYGVEYDDVMTMHDLVNADPEEAASLIHALFSDNSIDMSELA